MNDIDIYTVYKITNTINDKVYIGITNRLSRRWHAHKNLVINKVNTPLYNAIGKYGIDQFTITPICSTLTREDMGIIEQQLIKEQNTMTPNGYNLTTGGERSWVFSEESLQRMSDAHKGKVLSKETRQKISDAKKGKPSPKKGTKGLQTHSKETRQKMSESRKGTVAWNKGKKGLQTHSKETRQKMSDAHKGKVLSKEHRQKISNSRKAMIK